MIWSEVQTSQIFSRAINTSLQQVVYQHAERNLAENKKAERYRALICSIAKTNSFGTPSYRCLFDADNSKN